jgi:hypothetical protein
MMIDLNTIKLEDMAESARAIVEDGKDEDEFSNASDDTRHQPRRQQLKKLTKSDKKKLRAKAFKEEILRRYN